jgi:hypothetical protein
MNMYALYAGTCKHGVLAGGKLETHVLSVELHEYVCMRICTLTFVNMVCVQEEN